MSSRAANTAHYPGRQQDIIFNGKLFTLKENLFGCFRECYDQVSRLPKTGACIVAKDINTNGGKLCTVFEKRSDVDKFLEGVNEDDMHFYEVIPARVLRKLYFDIDAERKEDQGKYFDEDLLNAVKKQISYSFNYFFGKNLPAENLTVFSSTTDVKVSYHVVVEGYCTNEISTCKGFALHVKESLTELGYDKFVDSRVYSCWQLIRLCGSFKMGKSLAATKKRIQGSSSVFVCDVTGCERLDAIEETSKERVFQRLDIEPTNEMEADALEKFFALEGAEQSFYHKNTKREKNHWFVNFQMMSPWHCPICDREHDNGSNLNSVYVHIHPNGNFWLKCRSNNGTKKEGERQERILLNKRDSKKAKGISECLINPEDNWYWIDFFLEFKQNSRVFRNMEEICDQVIPSMRRVLAYLPGDGQLVVKTNAENPFRRHALSFINSVPLKFSYPDKDRIVKVKLSDVFWKECDVFAMKGIKFIPLSPFENLGNIPKDYVNTFEGFVAEPRESVEEKRIELLLNHIKEVWADNSEENFRYIISWLSHIVKYPRKKTETTLVILSREQGAGKGVITRFLQEKVFGLRLATSIGDIERVVSRFNSVIDKKLLVILDEASQVDAASYHKTFDVMKHMITETTIHVERKGLETTEEQSFTNFIITTNNSCAVKVDKSDRRYAMFECSNSRVGDHKYFDELEKSLDGRCAQSFMTYLLEYDGANLRNIPETKLRQECKNSSKSAVELFLEEFDAQEYEPDGDGWILSSDLYQGFCSWCSQNGYKTISSNMFGRKTSDVFEKKKKTVGGKTVGVCKHI